LIKQSAVPISPTHAFVSCIALDELTHPELVRNSHTDDEPGTENDTTTATTADVTNTTANVEEEEMVGMELDSDAEIAQNSALFLRRTNVDRSPR
jgi:hypothetical protein